LTIAPARFQAVQSSGCLQPADEQGFHRRIRRTTRQRPGHACL